jgi:L-threonylcarbamoyladenylate synthase
VLPDPDDPTEAAADHAVDAALVVLRRGGLVAIPTETVYGLAADASDPDAVRRIFAVKGRPADHPVIVHLAGAGSLPDWADPVPDEAVALAEAFWPGPLTIVLRRRDGVSDVVTGGRDTVGLRAPAHPLTRRLVARFGGGVAAPSANRFGRVSPTQAEHVVADLGGDVDLVLDGGPCEVGVESTIVEVADEIGVLRAGAVSAEEIEAIVGRPVRTEPTGPSRAPGMLPSHYAPAARVVLATEPVAEVRAHLAEGRRVAVLAERPVAGLPTEVVALDPVGDAEGYARHLYERLRDADAAGVEVIVAVPPTGDGIAVAVRDRLRRAANDQPG